MVLVVMIGDEGPCKCPVVVVLAVEGPGDGVCRFRSGDKWRWAAFLRIDFGLT